MAAHTVFLLSPASCSGKRASRLLQVGQPTDLGQRLRRPPGLAIADVFCYLSGLYFRGKFSYATAFADPPEGVSGLHLITPGRGLLALDTPVTMDDLRCLAAVPVDASDPRYRTPLERGAMALAGRLRDGDRAVLLGSVATDKYVDPLLAVLGGKLHFPEEFVGRGDMSRGGLLLRCVDSGWPLSYRPVAGAERRGRRAPRLPPRRR